MIVYLIASVVLVLCGILAASHVIVANQPNAEQLIGKIRPYQSALGIASIVFGVILLLEILIHLALYRVGDFLIAIAVAAVQIALGVLLGYAMISRWGNAETMKNVDQWRGRLTVYQVPLGFAGIVLGIVGILHSL